MTDVQVGDKVRVTFEGKVSNSDTYGLSLDDGEIFFVRHPVLGRTVEVIEKRPVQVGDKLKPIDHPGLPEHTVLRHSNGDADETLVKLNGLWHYPNGGGEGYDDKAPSWDDFTVVYIP